MLINKKNFVYFTFIYVIFAIFIIIFYRQLGIPQIWEIMFNLSLCVVFYLSFDEISNRISLYLEAKTLDIRDDKSKEHFMENGYKKVKPKNVWKYKTIFFVHLSLGVLLTFLLVIPLTYIFTVVHEFAHAITGLVNGVEIQKIRICGPREGFTDHSVLSSNVAMSLLSIAGSLGEIFFGIGLTVVVYRNKSMKLNVLIPIYYVIGYNFTYVYLYWQTSLYKGIGDAASVLFYNPQFTPQMLLVVGLFILLGLIAYLFFYIWGSINHRKDLFIDNYYPDFTDKRLYPIMKKLLLKKK